MRQKESTATSTTTAPVHYLFLYGAGALTIIFILQLLFPVVTDLFVLRSDVLWTQPWRLVSAMFLHGSWSHLFSNLIGWTLFGLLLEVTLGSRKAAICALSTGVVANAVAGQFYSSSLGASGVVFGLIGLLMVLRPLTIVFAFGVPLPMIVAGIAWGIANIGGLFFPSTTGYIAHLAGLGTGIVLALFLFKRHGDVSLLKRKKTKMMSDKEFSDWENRYMR